MRQLFSAFFLNPLFSSIIFYVLHIFVYSPIDELYKLYRKAKTQKSSNIRIITVAQPALNEMDALEIKSSAGSLRAKPPGRERFSAFQDLIPLLFYADIFCKRIQKTVRYDRSWQTHDYNLRCRQRKITSHLYIDGSTLKRLLMSPHILCK